MADVTGDLGGQPIQLNNAATELTLKQILAAMLAQTAAMAKTGKSGGMDPKLVKELEKELDRLAKSSKKQKDQFDKSTEAAKEEAEQKKKNLEQEKQKGLLNTKELKQINQTISSLSTLGSAISSVALGMTNLMSTLANTGNSMSAAANSMNSIPIVGGVLAGVFGAVAGAAEKTYKAFQQSASVGANFGGSITSMIDSATGAGLTFDQFAGIISRSGQQLALLGGTSEEGAKRLAQLGKTVKNSPLGNELARLGYSTEAINEGFAKYSAQLAATGKLEGMTNEQLAAQTGAYLKDLDALTKLTGKNKQELEREREARLKDAQFRNIMSKMDVDSQRNLQNLMDSIPAEHQEGMKEIIATGTATSEAGKKALAFLPESARNMMQLNQQIRTTGKMGADQAASINAAYKKEVTAFTKSGVAENMALYGDEASKRFYVGAMDAAANQKTLGQVQAEQQKAAEERARKEAQLQKDGLDPAKLKEYQEKIAQTSNTFTQFLANSGLLDTMMQAFTMLTDFTKDYVVPAFQFMANNFETIAMIAAPLIGIFALLKAAIFAHNVVLAAQTLKLGATLPIMAAFAGKMLAATLPLLPLAAVVGALYLGFQALKKAGWDFGSVVEAMGDNIKSLVLTLADGFLWLLDKVTFGDMNKKVKQARESLEVEKKELKEREAARDARRQQVAEERKLESESNKAAKEGVKTTKENTKTTKENTEAKEEEKKTTETATPSTSVPSVNMSTPQSIYDSMRKRMEGQSQSQSQPGTTSTQPMTTPGGLGKMSEKYETGGRGSETVGWDKVGGTSYGKYQIASKVGAMTDYLKFLEQTGKGDVAAQLRASGIEKDTGSASGKSVDLWKKLSASGALGDSEHEFIKQRSYNPAMAGLKDDKLRKMIEGNKGLQEMMWSTSVQHGGRGASNILNKVYKEGMTQEDLVKAVYAERGTKFGGSTEQVRAGVLNRFQNEQKDVFAMLGIPGVPTGNAQMAAAANKPATPSAASAQAAVASPGTPPAAGTTQSAVAAEQERIRQTGTQVAGTAPAGTQETPAALLSQLNTKMDTLVALTRRVNETNERQLSVQRNIAQSGDLYSAA